MSLPSGTPPAHSTITVSLPEPIEVKLVDAGQLAEYESWSFFTSMTSTAAIAFAVAAFQDGSGQLTCIAAVFFVLALFSAFNAFRRRRNMNKHSHSVRYTVGSLVGQFPIHRQSPPEPPPNG